MTTALGLLMLGAGIVLVFAAYRNVSPIELFSQSLSPSLDPSGKAIGAGAGSALGKVVGG